MYGTAVARATKDLGVTIVLEPGRVIVGNAGVLLTRVLLKKNQGAKKFLVVDAGMNDLIRPALYGSHHQIWPVRANRETIQEKPSMWSGQFANPPISLQRNEKSPFSSPENCSP